MVVTCLYRLQDAARLNLLTLDSACAPAAGQETRRLSAGSADDGLGVEAQLSMAAVAKVCGAGVRTRVFDSRVLRAHFHSAHCPKRVQRYHTRTKTL